ncbi:MAG: hypothetical protein R3Y49_03450 [Rikenellaceae bacterium]
MKIYLRRAFRYALYLCIILVILTFVLKSIQGGEWALITAAKSGRLLYILSVLVGFALLYPSFSYPSRSLPFSAELYKEDVERVMAMCGYVKKGEDGNKMIFRSAKGFNRLILLYEDAITITSGAHSSTISGPRREVVKALYRLGTFIK